MPRAWDVYDLFYQLSRLGEGAWGLGATLDWIWP